MDLLKRATTENQAAQPCVKVSAVHVPMQRAAMPDAVRCDAQRTALHQLAKNAATPRRAPAAYRQNALKDANVSSRSRFASSWRVRTDR